MPCSRLLTGQTGLNAWSCDDEPSHANPTTTYAQDILEVFASSWQDFDTVCMATAMHRLGKLEVGREAYDYLARQPDFIRLLTLIGARTLETTPTPRASYFRLCLRRCDGALGRSSNAW